MRGAGESLHAKPARQQAKPGDGQFSGMPRSIKTRLMNPRSKKALQKAAAGAAAEAQQAVSVSASGKSALGPWLGPYMPIIPTQDPDSPTSPTMFVHFKGRVFADLEGAPVAGMEQGGGGQGEQGHDGGGVVAAALPVTPRQRKDHSKELALMGSKGVGKRHNDSAAGTRFSAGLRRTRVLNQPRSGF